MRGTGRHFCVLTTIATVGALLTTPVATALAIATIWGIHHDDEHDVSEALLDPLGKACISFWLLSAASLVVCLLSLFRKAPTRLSWYAGVSVLMTLFLCWLGIISESTNGKVVLIIFALVDVVVVIAVLSFHMEAKEFERRPDHNESSATQLESADKTKVEVIARLLFFWTPLGTLFLAGILSTLVENSKWPLLATCAAVLLGSFAMFILSKGYHPGSSWDRLTLTSISVVGMVVTLFAVPLTITAAWQLHNDKIDSVLEKLGKSSISLWLLTAATSYICLMSSLKGVAREIRLYAGISVILGLFNSWLTVMAESIEGVPVNILFFIAFLALTARVFCLHRRPTSTPRTPSSQVTHTEEEDNWKFKLEKSTISIFHYTPVVTLFIAGVISNFVEDCAKPVVTTCATLIGASIANFGHSRALQGTATTDRVLIVSAVVGILVITPLTVALTLTYIWERHSVDEVARLPLGRASITFWLLTFAAVYIGLLHSSIKHAQRMLMLLVDVCVVMTVFLIFLGVMVESSNGLVVDIMLGVLTGILTIVTIVNQNAGDTELASKDPPDTEVGTEREGTQVKKELSDSEDGDFLKGRLTKLGGRSELRKKATTIFMATPFLVLFIAGLISTCVENCKLPLLATCCILVVGAGYIVALTVGYLRGSGIYQLVLTIICLIGMAFIPIAVVLTVVLIWRVHNNQKGEFGDEFWTVLADQEPEHIAMAVAKTAATCWIVASIALYVSCLSYFEKAPRKLLYLAYSCGTMTFLLLWLGAISESDYGVFVAACFLIVTFLITLAVPVVHLRRGGLCSEACGGVDQNAVSTREKLRNNTESWKPANASPAVVASKPKLEEKSPETSSNAKARPIAHGAVVRPQDHNPSPSPVTDEKFSSGPIEKTKVEPGGWGKVLSPFLFDAFQGDFNPEPDEQDNVVEQDSSDSNKGLDSDLEVSLLEAQAIASPGATTNLTQNAGTTVKTDSDGSSKEKGPAPVKQVAATNLPKIAPPKAAVELTFVNANTNPAMAKAELYLESTRYGPLGHKDPPLTVSTFPGHRWFIVVDGSFVRMYVVEEGEKQVCTI